MEKHPTKGQATKFVDLYELLQIDMNADADTLRKRIQQLYVEAQQNLDHRNAEKRIHFQRVHEIYMPQARYLLLDPVRRAEYNRYLTAFRSGSDIEPAVANSNAIEHSAMPTDAEAQKGEVLPSMNAEDEVEAQKVVEQGNELWSHWKQEIEKELAQSREELSRQKKRNSRLLWGAGIAVVALGAVLFALPRHTPPAAPPPAPVEEVENLLTNGNMTQLDVNRKTPAAWTEFWSERGKMSATHDTKVFRSAPASLCLGSVQAKEGNLKAQIAQGITNVRVGQRLRLKGFIRTAGDAQAQVFLIPRHNDQPLVTSQAIFIRGTNDWTPFVHELKLPDKTDWVAVALYMEGKGRAWIDDVQVTEVKEESK